MPKNILEAVFCSSNDENICYQSSSTTTAACLVVEKVFFFCDVPELVETVLESSQ